jgi:hypothetical protein
LQLPWAQEVRSSTGALAYIKPDIAD